MEKFTFLRDGCFWNIPLVVWLPVVTTLLHPHVPFSRPPPPSNRRPKSHAKARKFRQGLPVDEEEDENCEAPLRAASSVIAMAINPADPTICCEEMVADPWQNPPTKPSCLPGTRAGEKSSESNTSKRRKFKGERTKPSLSPDSEPWQTVERANSVQTTLSEHCTTVVQPALSKEIWGIEARNILPLLRNLQDAKPNRRSPSSKARNPVHQREVWTCGQNSYGELGHSDTGTRKSHCLLRTLEGVEVVDIAAGHLLWETVFTVIERAIATVGRERLSRLPVGSKCEGCEAAVLSFVISSGPADEKYVVHV